MRKTKKLPKQKFEITQKVLVNGEERTIKEPPKWNGFTWMYAFEGTDHRCGEEYLRKI